MTLVIKCPHLDCELGMLFSGDGDGEFFYCEDHGRPAPGVTFEFAWVDRTGDGPSVAQRGVEDRESASEGKFLRGPTTLGSKF